MRPLAFLPEVIVRDPGLCIGIGLFVAATFCTIACSGDDSGSAGSGSGGSGGGASGSGGSTGGSGGSTTAPEVFNPDIPLPSYDCRADTATKQCVSIRGTLGSSPLDRHCALPTSPPAIFYSPDMWPAGCVEGATASVGYYYGVGIPAQRPGPFHPMTTSSEDFYTLGADVTVMLDDVGGDFQSSHLSYGELAGIVETDPATGNDIIYGTFRATWAVPDAQCRAGVPNACREADVHGTFRVEHFLKFDNL